MFKDYIQDDQKSCNDDCLLPAKKTKIVFVHLSLVIGGSETVLLNYLNMLAKEPNYAVELLLIHQAPEQTIKDLIPESIKVSYILTEVEAEFKIFTYWKLKENITENERAYFASWDRGIKIRSNNRILAFFEKNKFDLIINFNEHLDGYLEHYGTNAPVIRWVHNKDDIDKYQNRERERYKPILAKHSAIITISKEMDVLAKSMLENLELNIPTQMIYNPLNEALIHQKMQQPLAEDEALLKQPFILSVARFFAYKNHLQLIEIYAQLKQKGIIEKLYLIGDGYDSLKEQVREKIKAFGLENDCILLGTRENPFPFMQAAKLFVHTSVLEGLPTVFIESMICGTPVVAFDCPTGPKEILNNGEYGGLIPLHNSNAFVEKTYQLLTDENALQQYKNKLPEAVKPFAFETIKAEFLTFLAKQGFTHA